MRCNFTHKELTEWLFYEPELGFFIWLKNRKSTFIGRRAGSPKDDGRRYIHFFGKLWLEHRLAWFYMHGKWPPHEIDHKDTNPGNNAIDNLREATHLENSHNKRRARVDSATGLAGVGVDKRSPNCYPVRINVNKKRIHIGTFKTPQEAHEAYIKAKRELHSFCTV